MEEWPRISCTTRRFVGQKEGGQRVLQFVWGDGSGFEREFGFFSPVRTPIAGYQLRKGASSCPVGEKGDELDNPVRRHGRSVQF
jgi:hypothetical protein